MTIQVVVTTYVPEEGHPRAGYLWKAVKSLRDNLQGREPIEFILAHDGPIDHKDVLYVGHDVLDWSKHTWHVTGGERAGIGGSLNRALAKVQVGDIWLYTTDDWVLTNGYDLTQAVRLIREDKYDYVRLGPPHPEIKCTTKFRQGLGWWLELYPECGGLAFATRPFLATRRFYDMVGAFKEHCDAYVCESDYALKLIAKIERHDDVIRCAEVVSGTLEGPWRHVGDVSVGVTYP